MSEYTLTPLSTKNQHKNLEFEEVGSGTSDIISHGLRMGGTNAEYEMAIRLQQLREACLDMVSQMQNEGYPVNEKHLKLMDVEVEIKAKERLTL